jgi:aromatic-L-amino-acid/L-tryptophan decarboxylase
MIDIESLRQPQSHPSEEELTQAMQRIQTWALEHSRTLSDKRIGQTASPAEMRQLFDEPPPEAAQSFDAVFRRFQEQIVPNGYYCNHPRFLAFVPGAPCMPSMLGDWLASAINFFCGVWLEAPAATQIELTVLGWFAQILGYPSSFRGILTSGGSEANLTAMITAREQLRFEERSSAVVYLSEQRHWSIDRALKIIGIHPEQIQPIPDDASLRLNADTLQKQIQIDRRRGKRPWLVCANGGATNTGIVDHLTELAEVCRSEKLWFHVDAAYGWAAALTSPGREVLSGIESADSITLDPHKWFAQTFEAGCLLVRDGTLLSETFSLRPDYMQDVIPQDDERNFADHGIALTRRFRALKIWFSVQMLGMQWFRDLMKRNHALAAYAAEKISDHPEMELLCPPQLSIVCFRLRTTEAENDRRMRRLRESGLAFLSSTRLRGEFAIRICFINWRTTATDVDRILEALSVP